MNQATAATGTNHANKGKYSNALRYGVVLGLIAVVRVFEFFISNIPWCQRAHAESAWWMVGIVLALLVCPFVAHFVRRHYSPPLTILLTALMGGTLTLFVSSIPGMAVGAVVGGLQAFESSRRITRTVLLFGLSAVLPAIGCGLLAGFLGGMTAVTRVSERREWFMIALICLFLAGVAIAWSSLLAKWRGDTRAYRLVGGALLFFLAALLCFPLGVQLDTARRTSDVDVSYAGLEPVELGPRYLLRGIGDVTYLHINGHLSQVAASRLRPFRNISSVFVAEADPESGGHDYDGGTLAALDLRRLTNFSTAGYRHRGEESPFDDAGLMALQESRQLQFLDLQDSQVTDAGLLAFKGMAKLDWLRLSGAKMTGSGLRHLNKAMPLRVLDLARTQVDDAGLRHLSGIRIRQLRLDETRVEGATLGGLNFATLQTLDLSGTSFDESNLIFLTKAIGLVELKLNDVPLTAVGLSQIGKLTWLPVLEIANSGVSDAMLQPLKKITLGKLAVDATNLTEAGCGALLHIPELELHFNGATMSVGEIGKRSLHLRETLERMQSARVASLAAGRGPPPKPSSVKIVIRDLVMQADMVAAVKELQPCLLVNTRIEDADAFPEPLLDFYDLPRFFPDAFTEAAL